MNFITGLVRKDLVKLCLEDAQDDSVDCRPALLPEEREETLHQVQRDALGHQAHDPVSTQHHHPYVLLFEVQPQLRDLFFQDKPEHVTVVEESRKLIHMDFFKVVVIKQSERKFEG